MQSIPISLSDPLQEFVDGQLAEGRFSSTSEYIRELIRAGEKAQSRTNAGITAAGRTTWQRSSAN